MDFLKLRTYAFIGLLIGATLLFFLLLKPFAYPIFWAAVIAALVHPLHKRLQRYVRHLNLSTSIMLLFVLLIIILPSILIGSLVLSEAIDLYQKIVSNQNYIADWVRTTLETLNHNNILAKLQIDTNVILKKAVEWSGDLTPYLAGFITNFTQNFIIFIFMFIVMIYTLFFFMRDGERMLRKLMHLSPFGDKFENILYEKFTATASATIKGTVIVGLIQGAIGGIMFWIAGIDGALLWAIVMAFLSIIPGPGAAIAWAPAALIMLAMGNYWQAAMLILVGVFIIGTIDNLLRPILVGKDIEMHELIIFFSTLGGIFVFGFSGFMIGPIIASLLFSFWKIYEQYFTNELTNDKDIA